MLEIPEEYAPIERGPSWWFSFIRFFGLHVLCLAAIWTGFDVWDVVICAALVWGRLFWVTAGYHRYFSHRTFKTSRVMQFVFAFLAMTSAQKGVLWWASHHRHHHKYSDEPNDVHSVRHGGFFWAHVGWIFHPDWEPTDYDRVKDFARYPELMWLDRHKFVPPTTLAVICFALGGWTGLVVWFLWSTVLLWHVTFTINSLAHVWGSRRYDTTDDSRNNFLLALLTLGEGWHNNHHHYQASVNQGFRWWQVDITYYGLWLMSKVGLVWDLRRPPEHVVFDRPHPVQQAVNSFKEAAAKVKEEALESIDELRDSVVVAYEGASRRWDEKKLAARAEAQRKWEEASQSWDQRKKDWDETVTELSVRWDESLDEIMMAAIERLEELRDSATEAEANARRAIDEIHSAASSYMEEVRTAARQAREELAKRQALSGHPALPANS